MKNQKLVGTYVFGPESVRLLVSDSEKGGGSLDGRPDDNGTAVLRVDGNMPWRSMIGILHHEAMEFAMMRLELRFCAGADYARDNGAWHFFMTHTQFSEASARAGMFMADCMPDLKKAWTKWRKSK